MLYSITNQLRVKSAVPYNVPMITFCNYIWRDPKTNIERYVGQTGDLQRPFAYTEKSHNQQLTWMLKKRISEGFDPQPEVIICTHQSANYARLVEACLIEKYGREDMGTGTLFNRTDGGEGGSSVANARWHKPGSHEAASVIQTARWEKPNAKDTKSEQSLAWWAVPANREARKEAMRRPDVVKKLQVNAKPCTVDDGITVYPSRNALVAVHGRNKEGAASLNFCWVVDGVLVPREKK